MRQGYKIIVKNRKSREEETFAGNCESLFALTNKEELGIVYSGEFVAKNKGGRRTE